jgi:hypothetical protein
MTGDIFGNLREWGDVPDQLAQLTQSGTLDDHQEGLMRLLRYRHNWRLREMALEAVQNLKSPTDRIISEVLAIVMDEGLYCEVRMLAAKSLGVVLSKSATPFSSDGRVIRCQVIQKMSMLLDSPQRPVIAGVLRECLTAIDGESFTPQPSIALLG